MRRPLAFLLIATVIVLPIPPAEIVLAEGTAIDLIAAPAGIEATEARFGRLGFHPATLVPDLASAHTLVGLSVASASALRDASLGMFIADRAEAIAPPLAVSFAHLYAAHDISTGSDTLDRVLADARLLDPEASAMLSTLVSDLAVLTDAANEFRAAHPDLHVASMPPRNIPDERIHELDRSLVADLLRAERVFAGRNVFFEDPLGLVKIAGNDNDVHVGGRTLLIDTGGDDLYLPGSLIGDEHAANGAVLDLGGNDRYAGRECSLACGFVGSYGVLIDSQGDDRYGAWNASQSFAAVGAFSLLLDKSGNDQYVSGSNSQAVAAVGAVAGLVDLNGDDTFIALPDSIVRGLSPEALLETRRVTDPEALIAEAKAIQGTEPDAPNVNQGAAGLGAFALFHDAAGSDKHLAGHAAMGSAGFESAAVFSTAGGNDLYETVGDHGIGLAGFNAFVLFLEAGGDDAYILPSGQGEAHAAIQSAAVFIDTNGNDQYYSGSVQAQAHSDIQSAVILKDLSGNDTYLIDTILPHEPLDWFMGQASAGGQQSIAVLADDAGDDTYTFLYPGGTAQGAVDESEAILLDAGGIDVYSHGPGNGEMTVKPDPRGPPYYGLLIDSPG